MDKVLGIDISYWQTNAGSIKPANLLKAKSNGAYFAFIRAHSGFKADTRFVENWKAAKDAELLRGAYHYMQLGTDFTTQINEFIGLIKNDPGELYPVLDVEKYGQAKFDRALIYSFIQKFMAMIKDQLDKKIILYTNPDIIVNFLKPIPTWMKDDSKVDLWVANYGVTSPVIGEFPTWKFWQYTNQGVGKNYGVDSAAIDLDFFNGTQVDLLKYANQSPAPPTPEPMTIESRLTNLENWATTMGYVK